MEVPGLRANTGLLFLGLLVGVVLGFIAAPTSRDDVRRLVSNVMHDSAGRFMVWGRAQSVQAEDLAV